ncbi:MAG: spiro-SPASM protein, partial [Leptospira sp.]|nr:spiro-SPASM protein [Leptospira sp.]
MKDTDYNPSSVAIFLQESQLKTLEKTEKEFIGEFFRKIRNVFGEIPVFINSGKKISALPGGPPTVLDDTEELSFLKKVTENLPASRSGDPDWDEAFFVYFRGICPLFDPDLSTELLSRHKRYISQYSYSENISPGILPVFISREFMTSLPVEIKSTVHDFMIKNINNYDVEIFYEPPDLRQYRLDFTLSDNRSLKMVESLYRIDRNIKYKEILPAILRNPGIFRQGPSYIEIEVYRGCEYKCSFCPRQFIKNDRDGDSIDASFLSTLFANLESEFPFPSTVCFGGMGEPLLHKDIQNLIQTTLKFRDLKELIIESALYTDIGTLTGFISGLPEEDRKKLSFIINLSTLNEKKYSEIYGKSSLPKILDNIDALSDILPKENLHVQILKMTEVEDEIENYFDFFEKRGINIVLQKYNRYVELMPEKRVSDLTPVKREFCWHLARDVYINSQGIVSICRQDFGTPIGNL